jgi:hypothetical protein
LNAFPDWFARDAEGFDSVLKAGIAHLWLVTIHPFEDGNVGAVANRSALCERRRVTDKGKAVW